MKNQPSPLVDPLVTFQTIDYHIDEIRKDVANLRFAIKPTRKDYKDMLKNRANKERYLFFDHASYLKLRQQYEQLYIDVLHENGLALQYIKNQSQRVKWAAVEQNPEALRYVDQQTPTLVRYAIERNPKCIRFSKLKQIDIYIYAHTLGIEAILCIPQKYRPFSEFKTFCQVKEQCVFCGIRNCSNFYICEHGHYQHIGCYRSVNNLGNNCLLKCARKLKKAEYYLPSVPIFNK